MKSAKHWLKAISLSLALVSLSVFVTGCGTFDATDGEKTADAMLEVMNQVQSVETSITLDIQDVSPTVMTQIVILIPQQSILRLP